MPNWGFWPANPDSIGNHRLANFLSSLNLKWSCLLRFFCSRATTSLFTICFSPSSQLFHFQAEMPLAINVELPHHIYVWVFRIALRFGSDYVISCRCSWEPTQQLPKHNACVHWMCKRASMQSFLAVWCVCEEGAMLVASTK